MLPRQAQGGLGAETQGSAAIHCGRTYHGRTYHTARRAAFQDYYALKSHCVLPVTSRLALANPPRRAPRRLQARYSFQERRLLRSEFSSRGGAAARVHDVVPDVVPVGAARRGRRALPWVPWCVCMGAGMACAWCVDMVRIVHVGRGRRPRRPAYTMSSPMSPPCARRAGDVAPYHGRHGACAWCALCMMVGADVPGGPRPRCRPRCRPRGRGAPGTSRPTIGAMARVHGCGHGVCMVRGHGVHGA